MKIFSSKKRVVAAAAIVLLLFLLRPGASRLKSRIVLSISAAVGRPVDIGSVHVRLLPRPGFDLENLVVYDDPAFSAEPMLRAGDVTAALRLTSLLRGRLEIARLDLTEPSLNLVYGENGRWNVEALLERTAHKPLAPTAKAKLEPRPAFPYIAASSARINFKNGPEKKPYALTNADFSLWQDSENAWGVRLKAQPVRTDLNLNDTGTLLVEGTWQRAEALRDTPLQFNVEWNRGQLGQFTKFITGTDQGWRGGILLDVTLAGTPAKLQIVSNASIQDFRRYDITSGQALRLAGHCEGQYSSVSHDFHGVVCSAPVENGLITLKGDMGLPGAHSYRLVLAAEKVPTGALAALLQRAKKDLPEDLTTSGTIRGNVAIEEDAAKARLRVDGKGEIADFRLASGADKAEIGPELVPFVVTAGNSSSATVPRQVPHKTARGVLFRQGVLVEFGPLQIASGHGVGPAARGWVNRTGYDISVTGEAEVAKTMRIAHMFGIPALHADAEGTAQVELQIAGAWSRASNGAAAGFAGPQVTGTARLKNVRVGLHGTGGPAEIVSAELHLLPDKVRAERLSVKVADASWSGSIEMPRGCGTPGACEVHYSLSANQIVLSDLSEWVNPLPKQRPWYRVLESSAPAGTSLMATLRASGLLTTDRLQVQSQTATHASANVSLDSGKVQISDLKADFLGGKHRGAWDVDFSTKPAVCAGSGRLTGISLTRLAETMKDGWIAGMANASYELRGPCSPEFWASTEGTVQFDVKDGTLPHISLVEDAGPLKVTHFSGTARVRAGALEIKDAKLDSPSGQFDVSGKTSSRRELEFQLSRTAAGAKKGYNVGGTLAEPKVTLLSGPETQARLKP